MNKLRSKYQELRVKETNIRRELSRAQKMPKVEVLLWLDDVQVVKKKLKDIEMSVGLGRQISEFFSSHRRQLTDLEEVYKEVVRLLRRYGSGSDQLFVQCTFLVDQCPKRSQLLDTIRENLMDPKVRITSIYGSKGVGKTTAMMKIRNELASSDIFDSIIWVTDSRGLSVHKLQRKIAKQMKLDLPVDGRAARLMDALIKLEKFLIILDNLQEPIPLNEVGIPQPNTNRRIRHKIVLITCNFHVCRCMKSDKFIRIDPLCREEKWDLFATKAGNVVLNHEIQPFARQIVEVCPGLPMIVTLIGHAMRDEVSIEAWRRVVQFLHERNYGREDIVSKLLKISYYRLNDYMVQSCFLYCALFPEDYLLNPEELIRYWIAESFIPEDGDIMTKLDHGFKIVQMLLDANMLEMSSKNGEDWLKLPHSCTMLATKVMEEENRLWFKADRGSQELQYNRSWDGKEKISLMGTKRQTLFVAPTSATRVSTLLLQGTPISRIFPAVFSSMLALKLLDLSFSLIKELPSSLSDLSQLHALFLHYCPSLRFIPSLEKMKHLQYLSLCGTSIRNMPHGMEGLVSLRSLDLSETKNLECIGAGVISSLIHLEELWMQGSGLCKTDSPMVTNYLWEMRSLNRLASLTISTVCYGDLLDTIMCLQDKNLKIFSINLYGSTEDYVEDIETM